MTLLEKSPDVANSLRHSAELLEADNAEVRQDDVVSYLNRPAERRFDIVFLDPPFADNLLEQSCLLLQSNGWLKENATVYVEQDKNQPAPAVPPGWRMLKDKKAGNVRFMLFRAN